MRACATFGRGPSAVVRLAFMRRLDPAAMRSIGSDRKRIERPMRTADPGLARGVDVELRFLVGLRAADLEEVDDLLDAEERSIVGDGTHAVLLALAGPAAGAGWVGDPLGRMRDTDFRREVEHAHALRQNSMSHLVSTVQSMSVVLSALPSTSARERLVTMGAEALSERELLALVLRSGARARRVPWTWPVCSSPRFRGLDGIAHALPEELAEVAGVGPAKAAALVAAFRLSSLLDRPRCAGPGSLGDDCAGRIRASRTAEKGTSDRPRLRWGEPAYPRHPRVGRVS